MNNYIFLVAVSSLALSLLAGIYRESSDLEVVLFGFASHDDIEGLIGVFYSVLDAVGHILLVLVWVEPYPKCPGVTS